MSQCCSDTPLRWRGRQMLFAGIVSHLVLLVGCGSMPPTPGAEPGEHARYQRVGFDAQISDEIVVVWSNGWSRKISDRYPTGWGTPGLARTMAAELLSPAGASVVQSATSSPDVQPSGAMASQVEIAVGQASIDELGRAYNPLRDFMALGAVGLAVGAAKRDEQFRPSFVLSLHEGTHRSMVGPSRCSVGLNGRLMDPKTGTPITEAQFILGQEKISSGIVHDSWETMTDDERAVIRSHCLSALRRGISQVLTRLDVVN